MKIEGFFFGFLGSVKGGDFEYRLGVISSNKLGSPLGELCIAEPAMRSYAV